MIESFEDAHDFLKNKGRELLDKGTVINTTNADNSGTLKDSLKELSHQFFVIRDPRKTIFNLPGFKTQPWWMVGELLTEFLAINPPLMTKYRPDLIGQSYKLTPQGMCEYGYGNRWIEHQQIENIRKKLSSNPNTKKAIIQTWMGYDADNARKDSPCNVNYMFLARDKKLDMTATIRSNDIMRGTKYDYALASFMQQSMASWTGLEIGKLYFHINSLHVYKFDESKLENVIREAQTSDDNAISLEVALNVTSETYWEDFRRLKKAEEASYHNAWDYCDKHINKISDPLFRDFARIFAVRNAKHADQGMLVEKYKHELETAEIRRWTK